MGQIEGALATIDAVGCQADNADTIVAHNADFLLAVNGNQPTLEADIAECFHTAPENELTTTTIVEKGHGRIETRTYIASNVVDWVRSDRSYPEQPKFNRIKTILRVINRTEIKEYSTIDERLYSRLRPSTSTA